LQGSLKTPTRLDPFGMEWFWPPALLEMVEFRLELTCKKPLSAQDEDHRRSICWCETLSCLSWLRSQSKFSNEGADSTVLSGLSATPVLKVMSQHVTTMCFLLLVFSYPWLSCWTTGNVGSMTLMFEWHSVQLFAQGTQIPRTGKGVDCFGGLFWFQCKTYLVWL